MQTEFSAAQLEDRDTATANEILRKCVHCGFCTATCPTYLLSGDELDSPRGRIYQIKSFLETDGAPTARLVTHLDRCLTCLSCMTTCPSGVDYMHLVDIARARVEVRHRRPLADRVLRQVLGVVLPNDRLFRFALQASRLAKPLARLLPGRLGAMLRAAPRSIPAPSVMDRPQVHPAQGKRKLRVALMTGCAQKTLRPAINDATIRLLTRLGCEIVIAEKAGCCGALNHHLGQEDAARATVRANVRVWHRLHRQSALDAVVVNASGCGTMLKDYGHMLQGDPDYADQAAEIAGLAADITEVLQKLTLPTNPTPGVDRVAYHPPCSLQHGQNLRAAPAALLRAVGYQVAEPAEAHICCGSAGTYSLLQADTATALRDRKNARLDALDAPLIATSNIGCLEHLEKGTSTPIVHMVELMDWATGGPKPPGI